ncbi:MAG: hypothetical protein ACFFB3_20435, partial [Candidatus Hodarchaeota archaeon]
LDDPRLAIPVRNAVSYHLAKLRNQPPPPVQKVPQPLFPDETALSSSRLHTTASPKKAQLASERRFIALDDILRSVTEGSTEDASLLSSASEETESSSSPFDRLLRIFKRKR